MKLRKENLKLSKGIETKLLLFRLDTLTVQLDSVFVKL